MINEFKNIKLPSNTGLYLNEGIPQMYKRINCFDSRSNGDDWMYIPLTLLNQITEKITSVGNNVTFVTEPVTIEQSDLYPVVLKGRCLGFVEIENGKKLKLSSKISDQISDSYKSHFHNEKIAGESSIKKIIGGLFQYEYNFKEFSRKLLKIYSSLIKKSCSGLYFLEEDTYKLRIVVGDINNYESLPVGLKEEEYHTYDTFAVNDNYFVPVEISPSEPCFVTMATNFQYIRPIIKSGKTKYLLVMSVTGDLSYQEVSEICQLSDFASKLEEIKFLNSNTLLNLFEEFDSSLFDHSDQSRFYIDMFKLLDEYINLSHFSVIDQHQNLKIHMKNNLGEVEAFEDNKNSISDIEKIEFNQNGFHIIKNSKDNKDEDSSDFSPSVHSELYYKINLSENRNIVLIIGCADDSANLIYLQSVLVHLKSFIRRMVLISDKVSTNDQGGINLNEKDLILKRFSTITKLSSGYYHDIFGMISVIVGQGEILTARALDRKKALVGEKIAGDLIKMSRAADDVTMYMNMVHEISNLANGNFEREISSVKFINKLPYLIHGYARQIQDSRNIILKVTSSSVTVSDFPIKISEIYDYLLPLLIGLFDNCDKSGVFQIKTEILADNARIIIEFDLPMVKSMSSRRLLSTLLELDNNSHFINRDGELMFGDIRISYDVEDGRIVKIIYEKPLVKDAFSEFENSSGSMKVR